MAPKKVRQPLSHLPPNIFINVTISADEFSRSMTRLMDAFTISMAQAGLAMSRLASQLPEPERALLAKIPQAVQALSSATTDPKILRQVLVAIILRLQEELGEEEPIVITEELLRDSWNYKLIINDMSDEGAATIAVRPR